MKKRRFIGPMGQQIKKYLTFSRSLGYIYKNAEINLDAFDQHLAKHFPSCKTISREMVVSYLNSLDKLQSKTRATQVSNLRQFCRFIFQYDQHTYIPEKNLVPPGKVQVKPHIFTKKEIIKLMKQTKKLYKSHALLSYTYSVIIGLLWVTGMRVGEVVKLKIEDVDTVNGIIHVQKTKFFKSRLIPLAKSTTQALIKYRKQRAEFGFSEKPGTSFFFNNRQKPCKVTTVPRTIRVFMTRAGLKTLQGKTPRVHDIRHSFATRWLVDFYRAGKDPTTYLPVLATYLGHANISNTQVYLHPSIELLNIAGEKLQIYTEHFQGEVNETTK